MFDHRKGGTIKPSVNSSDGRLPSLERFSWNPMKPKKQRGFNVQLWSTGRIICHYILITKSPRGITPLSVKHGFISRKSRVSSSHHVVARDVATHARAHQRPESMRLGRHIEMCLKPHQPPQQHPRKST